jgi:protein HOOK3
LSYPFSLCTGADYETSIEDIDSQYAVNDLEKHASPSKWLAKKKCLEAVYRSLLRYIRNHTLELDYLTLETTINLDAIAEHDDVQETIKVATHFPAASANLQLEADMTDLCIQLLTIFLMAAVNGPAKEKYIGNIMSQLDESAQLQIMDLIQTVPLHHRNLGVC